MSTNPKLESVIVVFKDEVTTEQIKKYADDIVAQGGKITNPYYESGSDIVNGFAADVPSNGLDSLKNLEGDVISNIESDGTLTIQ